MTLVRNFSFHTVTNSIFRPQAGLFLWQQLLPKKAAAQREELLKLDIAGVSPSYPTLQHCCFIPWVRCCIRLQDG